MSLYCYQRTEPRVVFYVGKKTCYKTIDCTFKGKMGRPAHLLLSKKEKKNESFALYRDIACYKARVMIICANGVNCV